MLLSILWRIQLAKCVGRKMKVSTMYGANYISQHKDNLKLQKYLRVMIASNCILLKHSFKFMFGGISFYRITDENGFTSIRRNEVIPIPDEMLELMHCSCTQNSVQESYPCVGNSLPCTDACSKQCGHCRLQQL